MVILFVGCLLHDMKECSIQQIHVEKYCFCFLTIAVFIVTDFADVDFD